MRKITYNLAGEVVEDIQTSAPLLLQIESLEQKITPRRLREAVLNEEGRTWLETLEAQISALRSQLNQG
jgi:polyhydroxyalkanoate synthesis regulator phasin